MAERRRVVFREQKSSDRLPDWASRGVVLLEWLRQRGLWQEIADRLKVQREGGYAGIDAFVFLVYYFSSGLKLGVKEFSERTRKHSLRLAAVGGRFRMPTQASMSRLLSSVELITTANFGAWLLNEAADVAAVLQHPSVLTRDAVGEGWHVFDWDPTVTTLRHRALPAAEGMPDARRRSEVLAKPGYSGRKRGEVQFSRATLQHAGSGLWLGIEMGPGNGAHRDALQRAIEQVGATCQLANLPLERAILRADGAAGNVPFITACTQAGVHYLTRLANYQWLQDPDVIRHLNESKWFDVPSSGSGPRRQATDLGQLTLTGAPSTLQADGKLFEPIDTRVIVSRFQLPEGDEGRGAGVVIQGWHYELYGTDLLATSWPEIEVVAGYYGRAAQENRFCQEDREFGLDRIFSYHLPGQMLATWIALFVWNFNICRGMEIERPSAELPEQPAQSSRLVTQTPRLSDVELSESALVSDNSSTADTTCASVGLHKPAIHPIEITSEPDSTSRASARRIAPQLAIREVINTFDWKQILAKHNGWSWSATDVALRCPANGLLQLVRVKGHPMRARFQADGGTCDECARRSVCIKSNDPYYRKEVQLRVPSPQAKLLRAMSLRVAHPTRGYRPPLRAAHQKNNSESESPRLWHPPELPQQRPVLAMAPPSLLPAALRKITQRAIESVEVHVAVVLPPLRPRPSPALACSIAVRQRRRLTWNERLRWNELPKGSSTKIQMFGSKLVQQLLAAATNAPHLSKSA